jgi:hypothetical protein
MRMNFFVFLFLVFLIIPFVIISCTRSLTSLIRPIPRRYMATANSASLNPTSSPTISHSQGEGKCSEGCCICGNKPVGHLFVLHDRSYRLCRRHLSEVPKLIDLARKRVPNIFFALTLYDYETITAVARAVGSH